LVTGVKEVIVATQHVAKNGKSKLVKQCTVPLTGLGVVNTVVTEFAVFRFIEGKLVLCEYASDVTLDDIAKMTEAAYTVAENVKVWQV
ncbi:MAG: CoA-transferase, partial [Phascolarctobacterium sp.]